MVDFLVKLLKRGFFESMLDEDIPKYARIISYVLTNFCFICAIIVLSVSTSRRLEVGGVIACLACTIIVSIAFVFLNARFVIFFFRRKRERRQAYREQMIKNSKEQLDDSEKKFMTE